MNRRSLLVGLGGTGALALSGIAYWRTSSETPVVSDDEDTTVHSADDPGSDGGDGETSDGPPADGGNRIEIDVHAKDFGRYNSNSVSFSHDVFRICNRGKECATVWIDADPIENDRGEAAVWFYRDGDFGDRLEDPEAVECLEPDECLRVGVMIRTFGIASETDLLERIIVRSNRA